jgi:hypothetical protein
VVEEAVPAEEGGGESEVGVRGASEDTAAAESQRQQTNANYGSLW